MFPKIKEYIKTNKKELSGNKLYEYLDELQNSKVFKHSKIHIIDNLWIRINGKSFFVKNLRIDEEFRFLGDIYLYSILHQSVNFIPSDTFIIRGVFENFTTDPQKVKEIDRLDKLDQLDI